MATGTVASGTAVAAVAEVPQFMSPRVVALVSPTQRSPLVAVVPATTAAGRAAVTLEQTAKARIPVKPEFPPVHPYLAAVARSRPQPVVPASRLTLEAMAVSLQSAESFLAAAALGHTREAPVVVKPAAVAVEI
jgi:hypothetical protein